MQAAAHHQSIDSIRASRAIGAIFVAIFGGMWLVGWSLQALPGSSGALAAIAGCTVMLISIAGSHFRRYRGAMAADKGSPARRKIIRWFNIINATQWILVIIGANLLVKIELGTWVVPFIILVVGLHFFPLAHLFKIPHYYLTGALLTGLTLVYPFVLPGGPQNPGGCLGAGLILWGTTIYLLSSQPRAQMQAQ